MQKLYIAPKMEEIRVTLSTAICSGGNTPENEPPVSGPQGWAPTRKLYV